MRLKSGRSGGWRKDERHADSMKTGFWSASNAYQEVRYNENERFLVIMMSRTSGVTEGLHGLAVGEPGPKIRQEISST